MKYTDSHEWIQTEGKTGTIGISTHAQQELGEVVYVELPRVGQIVQKGEEIAVLESTKAAADIYSPASGKVVAVNEKVKEDPDLLNRLPESEGWLFKIALSNPSELDSLLGHADYLALIK